MHRIEMITAFFSLVAVLFLSLMAVQVTAVPVSQPQSGGSSVMPGWWALSFQRLQKLFRQLQRELQHQQALLPVMAAQTGVEVVALPVCDPPCGKRQCCLQKEPGRKAVCATVPLSGQACSYPNHRLVFSINTTHAYMGHHCPCLTGMVCLANDGSGAAKPKGRGTCSFL